MWDEIAKLGLLGGVGLGGIGFTLKYFGFIGKKYETAAANMRGDVRAIETQEILNDNLADTIRRQQDQINQLNEKLDDAKRTIDEWREKYFALVAEKATMGRKN